jgi:ribosome-associated protein
MGKTDVKSEVVTSKVSIHSEYITLGQFLKFTNIINEGGEAKRYLASHEVLINGELDNRRGRKLRPGDKVVLPEGNFEIVSQ